MQGEEVVGARLRVLDILALAVKRRNHLSPLQDAFCHPYLIKTVIREHLQPLLVHSLTHLISHIMQRHETRFVGVATLFVALLVVVKPDNRVLVETLEEHAVPALVQSALFTLSDKQRVEQCRDGQTAVVVGTHCTVAVIPVVEVRTYHAILT